MNIQDKIASTKKKLKEITNRQYNLEKMIEKQEEDGNYDNNLYDELDRLEEKRNDLQLQLEVLQEETE